MSHIGLWFYRNEGGDEILAELEARLAAFGHAVTSDFDMRQCRVVDGEVLTADGRNLSRLDMLYHMNADQQSDHQREVLGALEASGVHVINGFDAFNRAQDKFVANCTLRRAGLSVPRSALVPAAVSRRALDELFALWGSVVVKRRRGHGGHGVQKFDAAEPLADFIGSVADVYSNFYLEEFIPFHEHDTRVDLLDGVVVGGYSRRKNHRFKTNVHAGAEMIPLPPTEEAIALAKRAARALGIDCTIVDMVVHAETGRLYVIEVNPFLGVFTGVGLKKGVNTIQTMDDIHPVFAYDDRKLEMLTNFIHLRAAGPVTAPRGNRNWDRPSCEKF
ncbi:RimK family alpha-L-glutamate ligase [Pendulispora albinea]|uniref:ATP-grasp domain-containing protein n=1 Tax=Pendulispora albinea TaxID=2741071 RepID=A0ABZ2LKR2_9BACT